MNYSNLPPELLLGILPYLDELEKSRLSRVCKSLRQLVLPSLYNTLKWTFDSLYSEAPRPEYAVWLLIRSILENPALGHLIEDIAFHGATSSCGLPHESTPWSSQPKELRRIPDAEFKMIETLFNPLQKNLGHRRPSGLDNVWMKGLSSGETNSFITLLLALAPKIKRLSLIHQIFIPSTFQYLIIEEAVYHDQEDSYSRDVSGEALRLNFLPELQSVTFLPNFGELGFFEDSGQNSRKSMLYPFFYLPKLSSVGGFVHDYKRSTPRLSMLPPVSNSLEKITFRDCGALINELDSLELFLPIVPRLRYLRLEYDLVVKCDRIFHSDLDLLTTILDLDRVSRALQPVASSLESLELMMEYSNFEYKIELLDCGIKGILQPLTGFERLETLQIPFVAIFGFGDEVTDQGRLEDILPRSLKYLILTDDLAFHEDYGWEPKDWFSRVESLLEKKDSIVPNLVSLRLSLWETLDELWTAVSLDDWPEWRRICSNAGVEFHEDYEPLQERFGIE